MTWFLYVECALLPLIIILEILALALLYWHKNKRRNKHQIYIIAALCMSELNSVLAFIVNHIIKYSRFSPIVVGTYSLFFILFIRFTYHSTMTILTIDRFLVFYLNIRYLTIWPPQRLLKLLVFIHVISFSIYICFVCLISLRVIEWKHLTEILFIPYFVWDVIYIVLVAATYFYIFCVYKKHKKQVKHFKANNKEHFKLLIPTLLIVTFTTFVCIPDFINIFTYFQFLQGKVLMFHKLAVFYQIGWLIDPLIYIYDSKLLIGKKTNYWIRNAARNQASLNILCFIGQFLKRLQLN